MADVDLKRHRKWTKQLRLAVEADGWGQVLEAVEAYEQASVLILQDLPDMELTAKQQDLIEKVVVTINLRTSCLSSLDGHGHRPTKDEMVEIADVLETALQRSPRVFPLDLAELAPPPEKPPARAPAVARPTGDRLEIFIEKIGLKDAERYVDPQIVVSVYSQATGYLEPKQELTASTALAPPYISFRHAVPLETQLASLRSHDGAVFFEFVHYKKAKRKKSVRCWAVLEPDELERAGPLVLELYAKPCDFRRQAVHLLTEKPLYLHVTVRFR
ncbi:axin interactor [Achlya hypogyna]|uniref:Axin interactor n=1 Tax=Achlya hypogyna TaxID=1202772 RepID=A0A1V9YQW5_ACHHY|nr:axin interactor [Achlya hypogyna]